MAEELKRLPSFGKDGAGKLKSYEIRWPSNDDCNRIAPTRVRPHERGTPDG